MVYKRLVALREFHQNSLGVAWNENVSNAMSGEMNYGKEFREILSLFKSEVWLNSLICLFGVNK